MITIKIALRNILRNRRRSSMTIAAIAMGGAAMLLFAGYMSYIILGFQTQTVDHVGHLSVFRAGYFDYGAGNPGAYGIRDYQSVIALVEADPVLAPMVRVVTPTVSLFGIAGNSAADASKTFFGTGTIPADQMRMRSWNEYHLTGPPPPPPDPHADDPATGVIGIGLARILGLCQALKLADCPPLLAASAASSPGDSSLPTQDFSDLTSRDGDSGGGAQPDRGIPRLDLLAATATGAPNVVSLYVSRAVGQGAKELDDSYIGMNLSLAQELLYGRGAHQATAIVLQLNRTEEIGPARARLGALFKQKGLDLEVRDFSELTPFYDQVIALFGAIFLFIAVIMTVIVLFTVANTMGMSVMERTNEIGTSRAMGVRRAGIRRQFLAEGSLLGVIGAGCGVILALVVGAAVNHAGLTWMPPGQAQAVPLKVLLSVFGVATLSTWAGLVAVAMLAALVPANRAARMAVVDALRHV